MAQSSRQEVSKTMEGAPNSPCQGLLLFVSRACPTTTEVMGQSGQAASHGRSGRPTSAASAKAETKGESRDGAIPSEITIVASLAEISVASSSSRRATGRQIGAAIAQMVTSARCRPSRLGPKGRQATASHGQRRLTALATTAAGHDAARRKTIEATVILQTSEETKVAPFASMRAGRTPVRVAVRAAAGAGRRSQTATLGAEVSAKVTAPIPVAAGPGKISGHAGLAFAPTRLTA